MWGINVLPTPDLTATTGVIIGRKNDKEFYVLTSKVALASLCRHSDTTQWKDPSDWDGQVLSETTTVTEGKFKVLWPQNLDNGSLWLLCVTSGFPAPLGEVPLCRDGVIHTTPALLCGHTTTDTGTTGVYAIHGKYTATHPDPVDVPAPHVYSHEVDPATGTPIQRNLTIRPADLFTIADLQDPVHKACSYKSIQTGSVRIQYPIGMGKAVTNLKGELIGISVLNGTRNRTFIVPVQNILRENSPTSPHYIELNPLSA
jgi:hypothetical protein